MFPPKSSVKQSLKAMSVMLITPLPSRIEN
jgi:hypothetical protein